MSLDTYFHYVLLSLLATSYFLQGAEANECPTGWLLYNSHCYGIFNTLLTWREADDDCKDYGRGAHLASILTKTQGDLISSHLQTMEEDSNSTTGVWIGLHDPKKNGRWRWIDLSILSYLPWSKEVVAPKPGTPSEGGCAYLSPKTDYGKWYVAPCSEKMRYMCRKAST